MKSWFFLVVCSILFISCKQGNNDASSYLPDSSGKINHVLVVTDNNLWNSLIGEELRKHLAETLVGMPQDEPRYTLSQMPYEAFDGFVKRQRVFVEVKLGEDNRFEIKENIFAKPQLGIYIYGKTLQDIFDQIETHSGDIKTAIYRCELLENQRRLKGFRMELPEIEKNFNISITIPSTYRVAKTTDNFAWIRRDLRSGGLNLLIYQLPLHTFDNTDNLIGEIIKIRDSIGKEHIPGPSDGSYMITEQAFSPHLFETTVDGRVAYETRGTWEVYNFFMAGPFVNYIIKDTANHRSLILEGFTFAPSVDKRDYQFELESIIRTVKISK